MDLPDLSNPFEDQPGHLYDQSPSVQHHYALSPPPLNPFQDPPGLTNPQHPPFPPVFQQHYALSSPPLPDSPNPFQNNSGPPYPQSPAITPDFQAHYVSPSPSQRQSLLQSPYPQYPAFPPGFQHGYAMSPPPRQLSPRRIQYLPPRVAVTRTMLEAYALMKGHTGEEALYNDGLHQALYFNPQRGIPEFRAWLPGLHTGDFDDIGLPVGSIYFWDPIQAPNQVPEQLARQRISTYTNEEDPSTPKPSLTYDEFIKQNPPTIGSNHAKGKRVYENFGYITHGSNGDLVDPDSQHELYHAMKDALRGHHRSETLGSDMKLIHFDTLDDSHDPSINSRNDDARGFTNLEDYDDIDMNASQQHDNSQVFADTQSHKNTNLQSQSEHDNSLALLVSQGPDNNNADSHLNLSSTSESDDSHYEHDASQDLEYTTKYNNYYDFERNQFSAFANTGDCENSENGSAGCSTIRPMNPKEEDIIYEQFVKEVSDDEDQEGDPRNYRISPETFLKWAQGAVNGERFEELKFEPEVSQFDRPTGPSKHKPTRKLDEEPQWDVETGSVLTGIYDVDPEPSLLFSALGVDMSFQPANYCRSYPSEAIALNRQAFLDKHQDDPFTRCSTPETFHSYRARANIDASAGEGRYDELKEELLQRRKQVDRSMEHWLQGQENVRTLAEHCRTAELESFFARKHLGGDVSSSSSSTLSAPPPPRPNLWHTGLLRLPAYSPPAAQPSLSPAKVQYQRIVDEFLESEVVGLLFAELKEENLAEHERAWRKRDKRAMRRRDAVLKREGLVEMPPGWVPMRREEPRVDLAAVARWQLGERGRKL